MKGVATAAPEEYAEMSPMPRSSARTTSTFGRDICARRRRRVAAFRLDSCETDRQLERHNELTAVHACFCNSLNLDTPSSTRPASQDRGA
eukprot:scaffold99941_cov61-Phaeocystis_antarctica.AAC.8